MKRNIGNYLQYLFVVVCIITVSVFMLGPIRENSIKCSFSGLNTSDPPIDIDGNPALDAWAAINSPGTDGLSWNTAHVIENYEIDAAGVGSGIKITNTDRYLIIRNCEVSNAQAWGLTILICQNVKITECYVHDNTVRGISASTSSNLIISDNTARRNDAGIVLQNLETSFVSNNIAKDNLDGFELLYCFNVTISGNTANNNDWTGIFISNSDNNTISDNTVSGNDEHGGIYLDDDCEYNEVYDNIVCDNNPFDILDEGQNNNIYNNTFTCPKPEAIPGYPLIGIIGFVVICLVIISVKVSIDNKKLKN
jgi:parallel beta-helix repeat protein